jgi:hypothetical protein
MSIRGENFSHPFHSLLPAPPRPGADGITGFFIVVYDPLSSLTNASSARCARLAGCAPSGGVGSMGSDALSRL